jgi:hypothetical protein
MPVPPPTVSNTSKPAALSCGCSHIALPHWFDTDTRNASVDDDGISPIAAAVVVALYALTRVPTARNELQA